jgi:SAM-dependent methyltransferase
MNPKEIQDLYDQSYADSYDATFRKSPLAASMTTSEKKILTALLEKGGPWLDVGCGTGYLLAQFPEVERVGLDLSPAMLAKAKTVNPTAHFVQGSFLDPRPEWAAKFRVVTSMWYAYALVDSIREVESAINHMADWTSDDGFLFMPACDPRAFVGDFPERQPWWGATATVRVTGVIWSYEEGDKTHVHLISPTLDVLKEILGQRFSTVTVVTYEMLGLLATNKR